MMIDCSAKDVFFSAALDGAPANWLRPSLIAEGLNPDEIGAYAPGKRVENQAAKGALLQDQIRGSWRRHDQAGRERGRALRPDHRRIHGGQKGRRRSIGVKRFIIINQRLEGSRLGRNR